MMNDKVIFELLSNFIRNLTKNAADDLEIDVMSRNPRQIWHRFYEDSKTLDGDYTEVEFLIRNIFKDLKKKDKVKCQFCRIDEGFTVTPPVRSQDLCKKHRQEYEEQTDDRTLYQFKVPKAIKYDERKYGR